MLEVRAARHGDAPAATRLPQPRFFCAAWGGTGAPPTPIPGIPAGPGAPCKGDSASGAAVFCAFLPGLLLL